MAAISWSGTKLFIATGANANNVITTAAAYAALTWTEIEQVVEIGEYGDSVNVISTKILGSGRTIKMGGVADGGELSVTLLTDMLLPGQSAFRLAATPANRNIRYNFKIEEPDKADANDTNTVTYFGGLALPGRKSATTEGGDTSRQRSYTIAVQTEFTEIASTVVP